jgi:predicted DNA binding CopG/RHH family protein
MTKNKKLNNYEQEILDLYENEELQPQQPSVNYKKIASTTLKKNRKINIRLTENDLTAIQRRAAREGIPYQTLIGSVLHKYVNGYLQETTPQI